MINLKSYHKLCIELADAVPEIQSVHPLTIEANMSDKVNKIAERDTPVLFFLPPSAEGSGNPDAFTDTNQCVLFVMIKFNPRTSSSFEALAQAQIAAENLKNKLLEFSRMVCNPLRPALRKITMMPETEFFGNWAGWSISFEIETS